MHCTFSLCSGIVLLGFRAQRFLMAIAQAIPPPMKNTPDLRIYVCFGSENLLRYPTFMPGLMCELWHNATVFENSPSFRTTLQSAT